jgi:hypothetical protein
VVSLGVGSSIVPTLMIKISAVLRARVGLWPAYEMRNRVLFGVGGLRLRLIERREVANLRATLGSPPSATVCTIIPTYRRPDLLARAVRSALDQTFRDQVVVVVDDGGGGLPVLPDDPRLHVVSLSRNTRRCGVARNVGIRLTQSRFIAFLDDDNEWLPEHLSLAVEALESGFGLVYTRVQRCWSNGEVLDYVGRPFDRSALKEESFVDANAIVVRRTKRILFSRLRRSRLTLPKEDWEFVYRTTRRVAACYVDQPTVRYLINDDSYYTPPFGSTPDRGFRSQVAELRRRPAPEPVVSEEPP